MLVKDIRSGVLSSLPLNLTAVDGQLFFTANDGTHGTELWTSDGTSSGTTLVRDIVAGTGTAGVGSLTASQGRLFFSANDGPHGTELWVSDGTSASTSLVTDLVAGSDSPSIDNLTALDGRVFFSADAGSTGTELWQSDGTAAGTTLVKDINPGADGAAVAQLRADAGRLFFAADDGTHGHELWSATLTHRTVSYTYDGLQRLTGANESPGTTYAYSYDDTGNRTGVWINGTRTVTQAFNAANQINGFSYDAAGNLTNDGTATYGYDALGRMTARGSTAYTYNGDGVLVDDGTTRYTQDLAAPLTQVLQTTQGSATNYLYGLDRLAAVAGGTRTWYVGDALGSVRLTLPDSGVPLGVINYDPWGMVESGGVQTFGFTGEVQDATTGLVNLRARWYSTAQGRFTAYRWRTSESRDTIPYSHHGYAYGLGDPVLNTDPSGKCVFVGVDTLICAGIAIGVYEAVALLAAAGFATYATYDTCQTRHACDQLAADLSRLLPDAQHVEANRSALARGFDYIMKGGDGYVWNDTPPQLNTGNTEGLPPYQPPPGTSVNIPQLGDNVHTNPWPQGKVCENLPGFSLNPPSTVYTTAPWEVPETMPMALAAASNLPIIRPGTSAWKNAVKDISSAGKSKNYRVGTQAQAEQLLKEGRGSDIPLMPTYTDEKYLRGYEVHPNERHTQNAPDNNLPHLKWKDWIGGKSGGANGHIFFGDP